MKLPPEQRVAFDAAKATGRAYSEVLVYGAVNPGQSWFRPAVSKAYRVALNRCDALSEWAKLAMALVKGKNAPSLNEVICASLADRLFSPRLGSAPPAELAAVLACGEVLLALQRRRGALPPEFGSGAVAGLLCFWLRSRRRSPQLEAQLERLPLEPLPNGRVPFDAQFEQFKNADAFRRFTVARPAAPVTKASSSRRRAGSVRA